MCSHVFVHVHYFVLCMADLKTCIDWLQCGVLKEKLDSLLKTLNEEAQASTVMPAPPPTIAEEQEEGEGVLVPPPHAPVAPCSPRTTSAIFKPREQLMLRANSLKKAIRQIIEHTEKGEAWNHHLD